MCCGTPLQENIRRNFGMPQPNGYRKAMRFMRHANKFGLPIVTFVDTPGAYAGRTAEELGQVGEGTHTAQGGQVRQPNMPCSPHVMLVCCILHPLACCQLLYVLESL